MDYTNLAQQYGATISPVSANGNNIDYSSLAGQYGATIVNPTPTSTQTPSGDITRGNNTNDGFFTSLLKDPIKTLLVKPAIRTAQAVTGTYGALTGNDALQNNANEGQTFDVPILGKYYIPGQKKLGEGGATQIAGQGLESASYLPVAGAAERIGASLFKGKLLQAAGSGALAGFQSGILGGAGNALQQDEPTFGKVLENTILGGGLGLIAGGTLGVAGAAASKGIRSALDSGVADFVKSKVGISTPSEAADSLYKKLADTNSGILNLTKSQINKETKFAKDTPLFIAKEAPDVSWNVTKDGRLDTQPVIDALEPKYHAEAQAFNLALKDSGQYASLDNLQKDAISAAKEQFKGSAQDDALAKIDKEILAYKKQYASSLINHNGETIVPIHILDDIKSDLWSKTKFYGTPEANLQSQTSYLMGNSAKNIIEKTVTDSPIKAWNSRLGDFASAIKILNQRNGIKVGAGAYSTTGARFLGGIAGHTLGGVPGEIAGMVTADQLVKMASDPNIKSFVLKKLIQRMGEEGQQGIIDEAQKVMEQRALERASKKLLSDGSQIPSKIELPAPGILRGQENIKPQASASQIAQPTMKANKNNIISSNIPKQGGNVNSKIIAGVAGASALGVGGVALNGTNQANFTNNDLKEPKPSKNVIDGIDINNYATDPNHEAKVQRIYNAIPETNDGASLDTYIEKKFPTSPLTGDMIYKAAKKYDVPVRLLVAILQQDSGLGTVGLGVRTNNPGNVGNNDSGATTTYSSWQAGVNGAARFLAKSKVK